MYQQLVTPNLDPEIKEGGKVLNDWVGWCLAYVKTAFSAFGATGDTAWKAWNATKFKHTDDLPIGVYVPIWFSGYKGLGHASILYKRPDGQISIWTTPLSKKPFADVYMSIGEIERRYGVTYVGWSEDIAGVQVIKKAGEIMDREGVNYGYRTAFDTEPTAEQIKYWVGRPATEFLMGLYNHNEVQRWKFNNYDKLAAENAELKKQLEAVKPVDEKAVVEGWFKKVWNKLFN